MSNFDKAKLALAVFLILITVNFVGEVAVKWFEFGWTTNMVWYERMYSPFVFSLLFFFIILIRSNLIYVLPAFYLIVVILLVSVFKFEVAYLVYLINFSLSYMIDAIDFILHRLNLKTTAVVVIIHTIGMLLYPIGVIKIVHLIIKIK